MMLVGFFDDLELVIIKHLPAYPTYPTNLIGFYLIIFFFVLFISYLLFQYKFLIKSKNDLNKISNPIVDKWIKKEDELK